MTEHKRPTQPQQGPHSSQNSSKKGDLGFDPDSPDLGDPQVDPEGPSIPPKDGEKKGKH